MDKSTNIKSPLLSIVVPLYNEEESFTLLISRLNGVMDTIGVETEVVLVDDGSRDKTSLLMNQVALTDTRYQCVFLSRNFGHQLALTAGLTCVRASRAVMVIDGDLQDPPELLNDFYSKLNEGYDVIYGVRKSRKEESSFKKATANIFYRMLKRISYIDIPLDTGDFCMLSRKVVDVLNAMPEESRYIRGMRAWVGFNQTGLEFERQERVAGDTKYPLKKMIKFAYDGIFNFSQLPIKFITQLGLFSILIALGYLAYTLYKKIVYHNVIEGFTGLLFAIILFSGVQLISLGIIGEYVLRIFFQSKQRPLFIIKRKIIEGKEADV